MRRQEKRSRVRLMCHRCRGQGQAADARRMLGHQRRRARRAVGVAERSLAGRPAAQALASHCPSSFLAVGGVEWRMGKVAAEMQS